MKTCAANLYRLCLLAVLLPCAELRAWNQDVDRVKVLKVKAAFLFNFARFVEWPKSAFDGPDSPFVIGVVGRDPFGRILDDTVARKTIHGRRVRIVRLQVSEPDRIPRCHVLFVPTDSRIDASDIVRFCVSHPVLIVGDRPGFVARGGMIGFVLEQGRIRFEVCREALTSAGLSAAASFLKLARLIEIPARKGTQ